MRRAESEPDYLLWMLFTLAFGAGVAYVQRALVPHYSFLACCRQIGAGKATATVVLIAIASGIFLLAFAAAIGWFAHRLVTSYGLRLMRRPPSVHRADYDDVTAPTTHTSLPASTASAPLPVECGTRVPASPGLWWLQTVTLVALGVTGSVILGWLLLIRLLGYHV
jgi:hypothetical protein